jgi:plastocyanin
VKVVRLELPGPLEKVDVRFSGKSTFESVRLAPVGPGCLQGLDVPDTSRPVLDNALYSKDRLLPAADHRLFKLGEGQDEQGEHVWVYELQLYPLRYNPARSTAVLQGECELGLHYKTAPAPAPSARGPDERYIIITSTAVNASGALAPLTAWKTKKGLPARVYEVSWIAANYQGFDTPEKIRNFLMEKYSQNYMQWVLLVGDNDTVPTRLVKDPNPVAPFDDGWIPADSYYACLDATTNWDTYNSNHVYGEFVDTNFDGLYEATDLDDAIQDVWIGRFSSSDIARVTAWANNAVAYEKSTTGAWMNSCMLIAPNAGTMGTAMNTAAKMEEYINKTGQGYYGYLGSYYGKIVSSGVIRRLYEQTGTLSRGAVISSINSGIAFGTWIAPGNATSISSSSLGTLFGNSDVAGLNNGAAKPVLFGMSSSAGRFDDTECLGEALTENNINNGAMGFIGASRVTTGLATPNYPGGGLGNGTAVQMDFLYQMQLGRQYDASLLSMGKTLGYAKRGYRDVQIDANALIFIHDYTIKAFYEYNLLGEPNSPVWTDVGGIFNPTTMVSEDATFKNVSILVRSMLNVPMNHTLVCLENATANCYQYTETSIDGWANFSIPKTMMYGNIVITRPDFTPYDTPDIFLDDRYAPYTDWVYTPAMPDGKANWWKTAPTVRLIPEQGVATYYHWDGGADEPYTGQQFTAPEGLHTLYFHSVDWRGNKEGEKTLIFKVDSQVPNTTMVVSPQSPDGQNGWYVSQPTVTLSLAGDAGSPAQIKYRLDSDPDYYTYGDPLPIEDGQHTLYFFAQDDAGNKERDRTLVVKVDTVAPSSTATVTPAKPDGQNGWYVKEPSILFFADDANGPRIRYWWDGGAPENASVSSSIKALQGNHTLGFQGVDEAGNAEEPKNLTIKFDSKVPSTNITTDPAAPDGMNGWFITRPTLAFDTGDPAVVQYKWNNEPFACATGPLLVPEGTSTLSYFAVDEAGNKEPVRLAGFKVDTSVPSTNLTVSPADRGDQWYTKKPRVKLANPENCTINFYWGTEIDKVQKYVREFEVPEGRSILHYWSIDEAGNKEGEKTKGFDVDSLAPSVSFTLSAPSIDVGGSVTFELKGTDPNGVTHFYVDFGDGNNSGWVQSLTVTHTYTGAGFYNATCQGRDPAGNVGNAAAKQIEVKSAYVPPVVKPPPEEPGTNWMLIGGVIAVLAVIGLVAAVAVRRRKPKDDFFVKEQQAKEKLKETMPAYDFDAGRTGTAAAETASYAVAAETAPAGAAAPAADSRFFNCPKCGNEVEKGAEYCYTCGERFKKGGPGGGQPPAQPAYEAPAQQVYEAPAQPAYEAPAQQIYEAPAQPAYEAPAQQVYEAPAQPVPRSAAPAPARHDELDDIMSRLESISHPAAAPAPARAAPARQTLPPPPPAAHAPAQHRPAPPPAAGPAQAAAASAQAGTGKMCPKCGAEMSRLVDLPGAQGEQLRKLNARGQHAFQCRKCNHFEVSAWNPGS